MRAKLAISLHGNNDRTSEFDGGAGKVGATAVSRQKSLLTGRNSDQSVQIIIAVWDHTMYQSEDGLNLEVLRKRRQTLLALATCGYIAIVYNRASTCTFELEFRAVYIIRDIGTMYAFVWSRHCTKFVRRDSDLLTHSSNLLTHSV